MPIRLRFRIYLDGKEQIDEYLEVLDPDLEKLAMRHMDLIQKASAENFMVEIEFLDEPDPQQRFFRFGTLPIKISLGGK
jgi:hypothetical protein